MKKVLNLTDQNFEGEVLKSSKPVLVDFWAPWCGPCRIVSPIIEELASEYGEKITVGKLNVDENPQVASKYGIMSIPTIMIFEDGKIIEGMIGAAPKEFFKEKIDQALKNH